MKHGRSLRSAIRAVWPFAEGLGWLTLGLLTTLLVVITVHDWMHPWNYEPPARPLTSEEKFWRNAVLIDPSGEVRRYRNGQWVLNGTPATTHSE